MIRHLRPTYAFHSGLYNQLACIHRTKAVMARMSGKINLTERESELFAILKKTLDRSDLKTTLRCAGGWVRDKLLNLDSDDIDIALDNMLGKDFAEHVNEYLISQNANVQKVAVITCNPEQSKHLETARMKLLDFELDLVNLRSETYSDSRIPQMNIGTPMQDAERRDLTINSLFFNINTSEVEDFTGKGLDDLEAGVIRTPLPPVQTFLDDPLRILRALRFAARFTFDLDTSLQEAASTPEVGAALTDKVSRERMGTELDKMFTGKGTVTAMRSLNSFRLFPAVFTLPKKTDTEVSTSYSRVGLELMQAADSLLNEWQPKSGPFSKEERKQALMAALLLPLKNVNVPSKGARTQPLTSYLILQSIKWRNVDAECIQQTHSEGACLLSAFEQLQEGTGEEEALRAQIGQSLKILKARRWRLGILLAAVQGLQASLEAGGGAQNGSSSPKGTSIASRLDTHEKRKECCKQLESAVAAFELEGCWDWKPLLGGKAVIDLLGVKGEAIGKSVAKLSAFHLANPRATAEDAKAFLRRQKSASAV